MNTNQKKKIIGVAVISGVILVSVTTGGIRISRNMRKRDEEVTLGSRTQISAQSTQFNSNTGYSQIVLKDTSGNTISGSTKTVEIDTQYIFVANGINLGSTVTIDGNDFEVEYDSSKVEIKQLSTGISVRPIEFGKHTIKVKHPSTGSISATFEIDVYKQIKLDPNGADSQETKFIYGAKSSMWKEKELENRMYSNSNPIKIPIKSGYKFLGYYTKLSPSESENYKIIDENGYLVEVDNGIANVYDNGSLLYEKGFTTLYARWEQTSVEVTDIAMSSTQGDFVSGHPSRATIKQGSSFQIMTTISPSNATNKSLTWASANTSVATVSSNGVVTGVSVGTAAITATASNGRQNACIVTVTEANTSVTGMSLSMSSYELQQGGSFTLSAIIKPSNATNKEVEWTSSSDILQIRNNSENVSWKKDIYANSVGKATITARSKDGNYTATCEVTVKDTYTIKFDTKGEGTIQDQVIVYEPGKTYVLNSAAPTKVGYQCLGWKIKNQTSTGLWCVPGENFILNEEDLSYIGSDKILNLEASYMANIYTVKYNSNGGKGTMTDSEFTYGTAQNLKANSFTKDGYTFLGWSKTSEGSKEYNNEQNVNNLTAENNGIVTLYAVWAKTEVPVTQVTLTASKQQINVNETISLTTKVLPENASNKNVAYTSSNEQVAIVDANGIVTGKSAGTATITVRTEDGNKTATYEITVVEPTVPVTQVTLTASKQQINVNETISLIAKVLPENASNKNVTYTSSNEQIATVDANGVVIGKSAGTATITVRTEDGNKTATYEITVVEQEQKDTTPPVITKVEIQKDSIGNYIVYVTAQDNESGIKAIKLVNDNGTEIEITSKTDDGRWYFMPNSNGNYKIKAIDNSLNETTQSYEVTQLLEEAKIETDEDENGRYIVYITPKSNKIVKSVKVNGTDITKNKAEDGRYYFIASKNGEYNIEIEYEDEKEEITYNETRIDEDKKDEDNKDEDNKDNDNKNNSDKGTNNGTQKGGTTGQTTDTTTALKTIPKTGTGINAIFAVIAGAAASAIEWFKQKRKK